MKRSQLILTMGGPMPVKSLSNLCSALMTIMSATEEWLEGCASTDSSMTIIWQVVAKRPGAASCQVFITELSGSCILGNLSQYGQHALSTSERVVLATHGFEITNMKAAPGKTSASTGIGEKLTAQKLADILNAQVLKKKYAS